MSHSYRSNYVHLVFRVASGCFLAEDLPDVFAYMRNVMANAGCKSITIGGVSDHVHVLAELPFDKSGETIRKTKTATTKWLKRRNPESYAGFAWLRGSGYFTTSYSLRHIVEEYILNQRQHHATMDCATEFQRLLEKHDLEYHPEWE